MSGDVEVFQDGLDWLIECAVCGARQRGYDSEGRAREAGRQHEDDCDGDGEDQ